MRIDPDGLDGLLIDRPRPAALPIPMLEPVELSSGLPPRTQRSSSAVGRLRREIRPSAQQRPLRRAPLPARRGKGRIGMAIGTIVFCMAMAAIVGATAAWRVGALDVSVLLEGE